MVVGIPGLKVLIRFVVDKWESIIEADWVKEVSQVESTEKFFLTSVGLPFSRFAGSRTLFECGSITVAAVMAPYP